MNSFYEELKSKSFSAFRMLSRECAPFEDANMLVGSADTEVSLTRSKISKTIDSDWIEKIENALYALDTVIRNPSVAIEDVDEVLPVELAKHITEKSIKHLAQHTNYILDVKEDGEVIPLKILNVFREESFLTYENKFVNTLLSRLSAFVDKRLRALGSASGIEMNYKFGYSTQFEHLLPNDGGRTSARINLQIELTSPLGREMSESDLEVNERFISDLNRAKRINMALISYRASAFAEKLGKSYIRPPVIRTNAILKNKNLRELLNLWEYIEEYDKVGYSFIGDKYYELPSSEFVGGMYSSVALQYLTLYSGIAGELENNRLISEKHLFETLPEFDNDIEEEELEDYMVYDSEYRKTVPVSRLMNNRKKLSEDEKKIRAAIIVSLKADEIMNADLLREEAEKRRLAREKRLAEEEARRLREEEERRLREEEERRLAEQKAAMQAKREVEIRYKRSFLSRYIQAETFIQDYYTEIKNELLSYKGVKARSSWAKESFSRGRIRIAKMDVKGKALYLYLALDPATLEGTKYKFTLANGDYPVLLKIKSERKKKYALELIAQLMATLGLVRIERTAEDYHLPYEDNEALIERGLIKVILPKGETLDENAIAVKADLSGIESKKSKTAEEEVAADTEEVCAEQDEAEAQDDAEEVCEEQAESEVEIPLTESACDGSEAESSETEEVNEGNDDGQAESFIDESAPDTAEETDSESSVEDETDSESSVEDETDSESSVEDETDSESSVEDETDSEAAVIEETDGDDGEISSSEQETVENIAELVAKIEDDDRIAEIIQSVIDNRAEIVIREFETAIVYRPRRTERRTFVFSDTAAADESLVVIPYTKARYVNLPRKKKKSVLMNVKKITAYRATLRLRNALSALQTENPRVLARLEYLNERLLQQEKALPNDALWADAVKRAAK